MDGIGIKFCVNGVRYSTGQAKKLREKDGKEIETPHLPRAWVWVTVWKKELWDLCFFFPFLFFNDSFSKIFILSRATLWQGKTVQHHYGHHGGKGGQTAWDHGKGISQAGVLFFLFPGSLGRGTVRQKGAEGLEEVMLARLFLGPRSTQFFLCQLFNEARLSVLQQADMLTIFLD